MGDLIQMPTGLERERLLLFGKHPRLFTGTVATWTSVPATPEQIAASMERLRSDLAAPTKP